MAGFNLNDYEPVEARLARAHTAQADLRVITDLVHYDDKLVIVKASVYKTGDDLEHGRVWACDYAQEAIGSSNITRTSWLETCATSAIGRALANAGFSPKGNRPSREEMQKASRPAAKVGGRPAAGQAEARKQGDPSPDPKVTQIVELVKQLDPETRNAFKAEFGAKPSEITDLTAALTWLTSKVEPF